MKYFLSLFLFFPCFFLSVSATNLSLSSGTPQEKSGIFAVIEKLNAEKNLNSEIIGELKYETELQDENQKKIQKIDELFQKIKKDKASLDNPAFSNTGTLGDDVKDLIETTNSSLEKDLTQISELLSNSTQKVKITSKDYNEDLLRKQIDTFKRDLTRSTQESLKKSLSLKETLTKSDQEIEKINLTLQSVIQDTVLKVSFFIISLIIFITLGKFLRTFIKNRESFGDEKKTVLLSIVRWVTNIIIFFIIILFFFSEFLSVLPFLAILGTALGLAIRDIIASFIAWFVIGLKDNVYKVGDVIEIDEGKVSGRVVKISPLVTHIQELGMSGPNGFYMTFPNKKIFEVPVRNTWRMNGWIFISFDFFLLTTSSLKGAKELLLEVMTHVTSDEKFKSPQTQKGFLKRFGHSETVIVPQVFLETRPQGILLRGKVLVHWGERHEIRSRIVEEFIEKAAKKKQIQLKVVDNI